jgi:adenosylhomocysteine nucleosidase
MLPSDPLVVFALQSEAGGQFDDLAASTLYTGVGKINATYALTRRIVAKRPPLVLSFGTAGSPRFATHSLVECTFFVQRDMDASGLGFAHGTTPLDPMQPVLSVPRRVPRLPEGRCGSGDSFVNGDPVLRLRRGGHGSVRLGQSLPYGGDRLHGREIHYRWRRR